MAGAADCGDGLREDERAIFTKLTGREHEPLQRIDQFAAVVELDAVVNRKFLASGLHCIIQMPLTTAVGEVRSGSTPAGDAQ
jgi:hypothetical protein